MTDDRPPDDALLEELKQALAGADTVPDDVLVAAKESFTWRTIDAELAELVFDSAMEDVAGVRGEGVTERRLTFRAADLEIEVMVEGRRVTGQLIPPQEATVELVAGGSRLLKDVDELGTFSFGDVAPGPVKLSCRVGDTTVTTEWTVL